MAFVLKRTLTFQTLWPVRGPIASSDPNQATRQREALCVLHSGANRPENASTDLSAFCRGNEPAMKRAKVGTASTCVSAGSAIDGT
jgi:hypothetical protein